NGFYEIRVVPEKGFGCFAINPIKRGTRILADSPLLIVPIAEYFQTDIQAAFDKLTHAEQAFYFTLHSAHGQDPANWPRRIHDSVVGRERQRIEEQHKARVGKEPSLISIFQTNCMEKDGGAAVFPNAARFNHSCNPNACFTWNPAIQKETVHAIKDIPAGDQITLAYCDTTHDKATRQWELKHYGFLCDCHACSGDESDSSSWAAKSAARRYRMMELQQETRYKRGKFLEFGVKTEAFVGKLLEFAKLMNEEGDYTARAADIYLDIALVCEQHGDLNFARLAAQKALQIIMDCAGPDFPDAKKYAGVVKRIKGKIEMKSQADREVEKR
ncbi:SET domain-containing protein, partial [Lindgomyces ingoldianus]